MVLLRRLQMAIKSVELAVENVLEEASPLSAHDRISLHWLEVTIRRCCSEYLDQPFAFRIRCIAVRINLGRQIIHARAFSFGILSILQVEQGGRSDGGSVFEQDLFWCFVEIGDRSRALADDLKKIMIVAAIESQIKTSAARIVE